MKKLLSVLALSVLVITAASSKSFFDHRYFELQFGAPVNFSNNAVPFKDYLKKEIVIDLKDIAEKMPNEGFVLNTSMYPYFAAHLNVGNVFVGVSSGLDVYEQLGISKDIFDFIGKGNQIGDSLNVAINNYADSFYHFDVDVGVKFKKFGIHIAPTLFVPLASAIGDNASAAFTNDADGNIIAKVNAGFKVHTIVDPSNLNSISESSIMNSAGLDLGVQYSRYLSRKSTVVIDARIPIVPGKLQYSTNMDFSMNYSAKIFEMDKAQNSYEFNKGSTINSVYYVNRPMKIIGYYDYLLLGKLLSVRLGGGLGVYHPFVENMALYPQYYAGTTLNLFNVLKFGLSTEYTDRIFKNQVGVTLNIRLIQIDVGASLQSASFSKSFAGAGYGGYAIISVGF